MIRYLAMGALVLAIGVGSGLRLMKSLGYSWSKTWRKKGPAPGREAPKRRPKERRRRLDPDLNLLRRAADLAGGEG